MTQQPLTLEQAQQLAIQFFQQQQFNEAEQLCQQILQVQPQQADILHLSAIIATQTSKHEQALEQIAQAIQINPYNEAFFNTQGNIFLSLEAWQEAAQSFQQGLALNPQAAPLHRNLGLVYQGQKDYFTAQQHFSKAIELAPDFVDAWLNLGKVQYELEQNAHALESWQTALKQQPQSIKIRNHVFLALQRLKRWAESFDIAQNTLHLLQPAVGLSEELRNDVAKAWQNWGAINLHLAHADIALNAFEKALVLNPDDVIIHSQLLWILNFVTPTRTQRQMQACSNFEALCQRLNADKAINKPIKQARQRLRIGYLSFDLREHPVGYFMQPILAQHDRQQYEIFCYYTSPSSNPQTQRLQQLTEHWRECGHFDDEALGQQILADELDILVELAGHTDKNRLLLLHSKLAPIQVSYLGYPNTSGLRSIDYRITDKYVSPEESGGDSLEQLIRLPFAYHCYQPIAAAQNLPIAPTPALQNGFITFASFNNYSKLTDETLALWAAVLKQLPDSRLLVKSQVFDDAQLYPQLEQRFEKFGIDTQRLSLHGHLSTEAYFRLYHQVDLCLDAYPYTGATTTCEALWMGTPTLTLAGDTQASRMSYSVLATVGLDDWVAFSVDEFIQKALNLSQNVEQLQALRMEMRKRLQNSPLMDTQGFTQTLENIYQNIHQNHKHSA